MLPSHSRMLVLKLSAQALIRNGAGIQHYHTVIGLKFPLGSSTHFKDKDHIPRNLIYQELD